MQFKNPEFLYALFLLLVPVIVHFFQLRKFTNEPFTNVKLLKQVEIQTRKTRHLKKWLTLLTRLLALGAIILAFAQPFIPHSSEALKEKETIIYIDNSFSMQQKGEQGELLQQAVQQTLQGFPDDKTVTVMTNDKVFNGTLAEMKNDLLDLTYSPEEASFKTISLKANNIFSNNPQKQKHFVALSDFQSKNFNEKPNFDSETKLSFIQLRGKDHVNYSIDSVYLRKANASEIAVKLSSGARSDEVIPLALYDGDELLAKSSAGFDEDSTATTKFSIPQEKSDFKGRIQIEDNSLEFDNSVYFSVQKTQKAEIIALNADEKKGDFLKRIFNESEFNYTALNDGAWDFNLLEQVDFIILNELEQIPSGLDRIIEKHFENGGYLAVIPSEESDLNSYNELFTQLNLGTFSELKEEELKIMTINFAHPLYTEVFDDEVTNFQFPEVKQSYAYDFGTTVLKYNNGNIFLSQNNQSYVFSAPLNEKNSNIKRSPLIVPTLYNMGMQSMKSPELYYTIGKINTIEVPVELRKDEVLHLKNDDENFIPQQQRFNKKVELQIDELPKQAGTYDVVNNDKTLGHLSFNYNRSENKMEFDDLSAFSEAEISTDAAQFFAAEINKNEVDQLWKWFVIFALLFLLVEVVLLKFLK